jgi:alpha-galactosidase
MRYYYQLLLLFFIFPITAGAQTIPSVIIQTSHIALVLKEGKDHRLYQQYFGSKLDRMDDYNALPPSSHQAYIPAGMDDLFTPAVRMVHADGNPSLELNYISKKQEKKNDDITSTVIVLRDPKYPVTVELHYESYYQEDIIKAWTVIRQQEKQPVKLTKFASCMLHFNAPHYWLTQFHGDWASEMKMQESELTSGIKTIDSKLGTRADMYRTPVFFLSLDNDASETNGEVIAGTLAWTGNFQFLFEIDEKNSLRLSAGMNPYASAYTLQPGKDFVTPVFIFTYSDHGKGQASRNFDDWARRYDILDGEKPRLTLLNNWEATGFNFDEKKLVDLFDSAKELGVDLFLLDDGWFGNKYPRNDDHAGLGDWQANKQKLPDGIGYLVHEADKRELKFGIWLEPEMVNPESELYHKHADWILKLPNRPENYFRNQLVLDLTNPAVQDFVYYVVDNLLTKNPRLAYIKWDCNRMMTNTYSPYLGKLQSNLYIDYVKGLYSVLQRIRKKYPHLPMMLCSGGGGRTDYGALQYFTEFWPSDNTDALERVFIQWGYSYFFPSLTVCNHITSWGKESLKFRTDVAMMGKLGYDIKVSDLNDRDLHFSQQAVQLYNKIKETVWSGDLYRLISPYEENRAVLMYVSKDKNKAILFDYNLHTRYKEIFGRVRLQGLDPHKQYKIEEVNLYPGTQSGLPENGQTLSGDYLTKVGLNLSPQVQPLTSKVIEITAK